MSASCARHLGFLRKTRATTWSTRLLRLGTNFSATAIMMAAGWCVTQAISCCGGEPLQVFTNGPGRISPYSAGELLEVWGTYTMTAIPEPGFAFHSWQGVNVYIKTTRSTNSTGTVSTNVETSVTGGAFYYSPDLTFKMRPVSRTAPNEQLSTESHYGWRANFGPPRGAVELDVYRTIPEATAVESGSYVKKRTVPVSATLSFDFSDTPPSLVAAIPNAVLEGSRPFPLTVRSYNGYQLTNGTYKFVGHFDHDIYPGGSQYYFDWQFYPTNGGLAWNGSAHWIGGHSWYLSFSNVLVVPQAQLSLALIGPGAIQATWKTNFSHHILEHAPSLTDAAWSIVTNAPSTIGNRRGVILDTGNFQGFYRLRQP